MKNIKKNNFFIFYIFFVILIIFCLFNLFKNKKSNVKILLRDNDITEDLLSKNFDIANFDPKKIYKEKEIFKNNFYINYNDNEIYITLFTDINFSALNKNGDISSLKKEYDYNIIKIVKNKINVIESNCRDKICQKTSLINSNIINNYIVCLPHKLIIKFD